MAIKPPDDDEPGDTPTVDGFIVADEHGNTSAAFISVVVDGPENEDEIEALVLQAVTEDDVRTGLLNQWERT